MTTKLTPDQLHRLIDEVAELVDFDPPTTFMGKLVVIMNQNCAYTWWNAKGREVYRRAGYGHAGLSAVLILLSEGG